MIRSIQLIFYISLISTGALAWSSFSSSSPSSPTSLDASPSRSRIQEALRSLSGKPTITPEIVIPEPNDPTVLLLRSSQVTQLSNNIRTKAKANAALVVGSMDALQTFCTEQETGGKGNIPGPIPVLYAYQPFVCGNVKPTMEQIAKTGALGILHTLCHSSPILNKNMILEDAEGLVNAVQEGKKYGIQIIPELVVPHDLQLSHGEKLKEDDLVIFLDTLASIMGGSDPAAIVLSIQDSSSSSTTTESTAAEENWAQILPQISKSLTKRVPIVGSIRVKAGQNRMGAAVTAYKAAGFTGSILRSECVPGFRMNPDLQFVSGFWTAAIADIKSTKSKSFNFRSEIKQEFKDRDLPMEWYNYQKNVMDSGALGESVPASNVNTGNGDYVGF